MSLFLGDYDCARYPAVAVQQTSGDDGVQEDVVCSDDVVEVLGLLHFVPQLVPGALQHLRTHRTQTHTLAKLCGNYIVLL